MVLYVCACTWQDAPVHGCDHPPSLTFTAPPPATILSSLPTPTPVPTRTYAHAPRTHNHPDTPTLQCSTTMWASTIWRQCQSSSAASSRRRWAAFWGGGQGLGSWVTFFLLSNPNPYSSRSVWGGIGWAVCTCPPSHSRWVGSTPLFRDHACEAACRPAASALAR